MSNFLRPDVYVEKVANTVVQTESYKSIASTPVIIGTFPRGAVGTPLLVNNWTEFCEAISLGLDSPYLTGSYTTDAVYGFFQNGGSRLYLVRVMGPSGAKASGTIATGPVFTAKDEGLWGNDLEVVVSTSVSGDTTVKTVSVKLNSVEMETFSDTFLTASEDYTVLNNKINLGSDYITVSNVKTVVGTATFTGGTGDEANITDEVYTGSTGIHCLDNISDFGLLAIPGVTSTTVLQAIVTYCDGRRNCYPVLDLPKGANATATIASRLAVTGSKGAFYYPWLKITDPTSPAGVTKIIPPSGHVLGVYARTDKARGMSKAPAGISANLLGLIGAEFAFTETEIGQLNSNHINTILNKPNRGFVIWGARNVSAVADKFYISDVRFDMDIELSCYNAIEWSLFEPATLDLCEKIGLSLKDVLKEKFDNKELKGSTEAEAYFVKCDEELNPQSILDDGMVIAEIGYSKNKPNEFTVIRIKQMVNVG